MVVLTSFASLSAGTARLALPAVLAVAAAGLAVSLPPTPPGRELGWAAAAALGTFAAFAAPVVLSGEATFAGYVKLDDTATFLALVDRALEHGRSLEGLAPSSYEAALAFNLHFYPLGSLLPLGVGARLVGEDAAWVFQPYLAFLAAMLAFALYQLAALVVSLRPLRAVAALLGSQAALLYAYALWGGVKELAAAALVALLAALAGTLYRDRRGALALVPLALAAAALVGVLSIGAAAWLLPVGLVALAGLRRGGGRRPLVLAGLVAALVLPSLAVARLVLGEGVLGSLRTAEELGNLLAPLSILQTIGVWPAGDFRVRPDDMVATSVLLLVVVAAAGLGLGAAVARRAWEIPLYAASALGAAFAFAVLGSPWVEAKAFAIASPAIVFAAVLGCTTLLARGRRVEGAVALLLVAGGVLWSNALAFREVNLAPRAQLAELEQIGERFRGQGPALMTEYQPYGVRHFLRELDAEGASELRRRPVRLRDGSTLPKGGFADLAAFDTSDLSVYRTLVLRRSPDGAAPPPAYSLVWSGRWYEVWQRTGQTSGPPACRRRPITIPTGSSTVRVDRTGAYELWIGGSVRGRLRVEIDGRRAGEASHELGYGGQYVPLGRVRLAAGTHSVTLDVDEPALQPGSGGAPSPIGPLALSPAGDCGSAPA
jgi:hypothetical protein